MGRGSSSKRASTGGPVAHLEGRFADDVAAYDQVHEEILTMVDVLSSGIEQQFPSRFA